jgi:diguanylate cyclase (GGDEF)-like protein
MNNIRVGSQAFLIILIGSLIMGSLIFSLGGSNQRFAESAALETARSYSNTFTGIRGFYQENVVERLAGTNAVIAHNFRELEGAVPIPATMMIELTSYLNQTSANVTFALVSDYPFPWRAERPLVDFDGKAIEQLRDTGATEYYEFREENETVYLHYAKPVLMEEGCVYCHNNHPSSPKRDWEVGDVRAVQIFELPFDEAASDLTFDTAIFVSIIIIISVTTIFTLLASTFKTQRTQNLLRSEAHYDRLTGAMRRPRFQELYDVKNRGVDYYLALIDIDDFKSYNTDFGHSTGDKILQKVSENLDNYLPQKEVLCRYGGEEFVILVETQYIDSTPEQFFAELVQNIREATIDIGDYQINPTISLGYLPLHTDDELNTIAERADAALRFAKRNGKNQAVMADTKLLQSLGYLDHNYRTSDVEAALHAGDMYYAFQPIVELETGKVIYYEALIRWRQKDGDAISPSSFLPQFISALRGRQNIGALRETIRRSIAESNTEVENLRNISFNLDPYDLVNNLEENCLTFVLVELLKDEFNIAIEVTETPYIENIPDKLLQQKLDQLSKLGFRIYMDDFGKEGSSLQRFSSYSFDAVKVDKSIVEGIEDTERKKGLISILVQLTQAAKIDLIVEGIETQEQRDILRRLGVQKGQGFYFSRPE